MDGSEEHLRRMIDRIPALAWSCLPDGSTEYLNRKWLEYTGLSLKEALGWGWKAAIHPEDLEPLMAKWYSHLRSEEGGEAEARLRRFDGEYRWFLFRAEPARDERGAVTRWYGTNSDIEERKQAEQRLRNEILALREEIERASMFEEIVGSSEPLRAVLRQAAGLSQVDTPVLILGEPGTGKELVARAIHRQSGRAERAFLRVDCAALSPSLVVSELFGHEKDAFEGALQRRMGRFEAADGGTIYLDDVGSLPMEAQCALSKALRERAIERLGGNRPIPVDVRVLAATKCDLAPAVAEGGFRPDLLAILGASSLRIPPLRERPDDIQQLVEYFADRYSKAAGKEIRIVGGEVLALFQAHDWPGNVRELRNVVERAVILCDGNAFTVSETWLKGESPRRFGEQATLSETLSGQEREMIEAMLAECRGRISGPSGAATRLGIPRQTLESKIRRLEINKYRFKI
ncbi:MAG: sigma 54-interacting transcriptional regulator [Thermodesulfobacteriota bacterium]